MNEYLPTTYGDRIADAYDLLYRAVDPAAIDLLARLAGEGPALELGIGTGRLALPLAARGVTVHGIDASEAMVRKLQEKPGGNDIPVTIGDFAELRSEEHYSLIYVVFNTFFALQTQEEQVRCFQSVASQLRDDGCFLLEVFIPDLTRFDRGQRTSTFQVETDAVTIEATRHDPVAQRVESQMIRLTEAGVRLFPVQLRYAWPSELDLMGRLAGLRLRNRWGGWEEEVFGAGNQSHISVYCRSA